MTFLYLSVRYTTLPYVVIFMLITLPTISVADAGNNLFLALNWLNVVVTALLGIIMIARLHAMYRRSRNMLIFLVATFLGITIPCVGITAAGMRHTIGEEFILSGAYQCNYNYEGDARLLNSMTWILCTLWEVLLLCLAIWIAVKYFRELPRRPLRARTIDECLMVVIKTHVVYFGSFTVASCFALGFLSPTLVDSNYMGTMTYHSILDVVSVTQLFMLGPRLILSVREYDAMLVADPDAGTYMPSLVFYQHAYASSTVTV
ncbi:uncharacterized protein HD556DRAFT_1325726 [Suillus plorans]|uniref:Uncharacterized protein n=1 Tax=Suillus plorans TaxID=116603 RepID=A0A9P7J636_9AGAM|nr:uncharacterized protein HD556DRAFT_1325726 [Suillus plorans]KAG1804717.1 hypothetical protein HD556DRAFT_1325726 [Suillus plorans]